MNIDIYTDGACSGNPGPGGAGVVILFPDEKIAIGKKSKKHTTNNEQELTAILIAFKEVLRKLSDDISYTINSLTLYTDSQYSIGCLTQWYNGYIRRNWRTSKGTPVMNRELIEKVKKKEEVLRNLFNIEIEYKYVPGHSGHKQNELADTLAVTSIREGDICVRKPI